MRLALPLVGRDQEYAELKLRLDASSAGRGGVALINGEAGIGKSSLLDALQRADDRHLSVTGRCPGPFEAPPYGPWLEVAMRLESMAGLDRSLLPAPLGHGAAPASPYQQAAALLEWFRRMERPLLIAIEDLHWADPASLDMLRHLAPRLSEVPVLIVATYRSDEVQRTHPLWTLLPDLQRGDTLRIALSRLTEADVAALVRAALPDLSDSVGLAHRLHARTDGHSLFVRDLLMAVAREGIAAVQGNALPETVQQAIDRRLVCLSPGAQSVLQVAAVIGEWFSYDLLARVVDLSEDELLSALDEAVALRLIRTEEERFCFDHALVREVLIHQVIPPRRRRSHLRIAEALLASPRPDPELVALHLSRAADPRAPQYLIEAASKARREGALDQAGQYLQQALEQMPADDPARPELLFDLGINLSHAYPERALTYLEEAVKAAEAQGNRGVAAWARARHAYYSCAEHVTIAQLQRWHEEEQRLADDKWSRRLTERFYVRSGPMREAGTLLVSVLLTNGLEADAKLVRDQLQSTGPAGDLDAEIAYAEGDSLPLLQFHESIAGYFERTREAGWAVPNYKESILLRLLFRAEEREAIEPLVVRFRELEAGSIATGYPYMPEGMSDLGFYEFLRGDWESAWHNMVGYLSGPARPRRIDRPMRPWAALLQMERGDLAGAARSLAPLHPAHPQDETGLPYRVLMAKWLRVRLHLAQGNPDAALAWLEAANRWLTGAPHCPERSFIPLAWAEYWRANGDPLQGWEQARQALDWARTDRLAWAEIMAHRLLGELAPAAGRGPGEAEAHLEAAIDLAVRCGFPYEEALSRLALGRPAEVPEVIALLTRLGAEPALRRAQALMEHRPAQGQPAHGLTAREIEVVRLVAEGLTDKEIGERLFISRRTVDAHLRHIFNKVGVSNRTTLAAFAARELL